jgi:hypothetical protein
MMTIHTPRALAALAILIMTLPASGNAAGTTVRARFSFDALATCTQPAVQNYAVHAEGSGTLSTDRTATLDMSSNIQGKETYTAKLGGRPTEALGGSASLRVMCQHTLRAVREYPNNLIIATMTVIGKSCRLSIENRLKPGKREYTCLGNGGVAHCSRPRLTHAECTPY